MKSLKYFAITIILVFFSDFLQSEQKKTICLNMIVKNESAVICQCLRTVKPLIDYWVIVDTGSTDGTQNLIKKFMQDVPGELHEKPWVDFAHNRNEALQLAKDKADYVLIMDADDFLEFSNQFIMPDLDKDSYFFSIEDTNLKYYRRQLIKNNLPWEWKGVLHEYLNINIPTNDIKLAHVIYRRTGEGARSKDPLKFHKDIQVLEKALTEEPENERYMFYLAQSYKSIKNYEKAIESYKKRIEMKGWDQEVFYSLLQVGVLQDVLEMPSNTVTESFYNCYLFRPSRAEPLYYLASHHRKIGNYFAGYYIAEQGLSIPIPRDILFVEDWVYKYGLLFEYSLCAYWIGEYKKAEDASFSLLDNPSLPLNYRRSVEWNLSWIEAKLAEIH